MRTFMIAAAVLSLALAAVGCNQSGEASGAAAEGATGRGAGEHGGGEHAAFGQASSGHAPASFATPPAVGTQAYCPVMGHDFTVAEDSPRSEHGGRHYAFCCQSCKTRFDASPGQYASSGSPAPSKG